MRNLVVVSLFTVSAAACALDSPDLSGLDAGSKSTTTGSTGDTSSSSSGSTAATGSTGSTSSTSSSSSGSGGSTGSSSSAVSSGSGGSGESGGSGGAGGSTTSGSGGSGGSTTGGSGGSSSPDASAAGGSGGSGGSGGAGGMNKPDAGTQTGNAAFDGIKGMRLDDACGGPDTSTTCLHSDKMSKYHATKQITLTGDAAMYNVKIRFRGVTEPTIINGASNPDSAHTQFAKGGTFQDRTYQTWYFGVSNPSATYYLNAFKQTGHVAYLVDYTETIPMAANAVLKLDIQDDNNHLILNGDTTGINDPSMPNAPKKTVNFTDIPGSVAGGQFIQLELVSVTPM